MFLLFLLSISSVSAEDNLNDISDNINSNIIFNSDSNPNSDGMNADNVADQIIFDEKESSDKLNKLSSNNLMANSIFDSSSSSGFNLTDIEENSNGIKNSYLSLMSEKDWKIKGEGENYFVKLSDEDGNPIPNTLIYFEIKSSYGTLEYDAQTDSRGIASLPLELSHSGVHTITSSFDGEDKFNKSVLSSKVYVYKESQIKLAKSYGFSGEDLTINLYGNGALQKNKNVTVYVGTKKYVKKTDSKGSITVKLPSDVSQVLVHCHFEATGYYYGSDLIQTIPVYKRTFTKNNVYSLLKGSYFRVTLKGRDGKILSSQNITFSVSGKSYIKKTNSKGMAALKINLKRGVYRISYSFKNNGIYGASSNHTDLNVIDPSGQYKKLLNVKTSASVKKYLSGGGYATITSSIRNMAKKITKKYNNNFDKAVAIFNYVRDTLDYQYYANTRKGASKTLKTKAGNCCDHANLIVALCRAAKIPARYSHSKSCLFGSGHREGHVWAQIYVGGTWYSADGTSLRNSFGHIEKWNTRTNRINNNYRSLPF